LIFRFFRRKFSLKCLLMSGNPEGPVESAGPPGRSAETFILFHRINFTFENCH
jgi:hypothetical protein